MMIYNTTDRFCESLFRAGALLSPYLLTGFLGEVESRGAQEGSSRCCALRAPWGRGCCPVGGLCCSKAPRAGSLEPVPGWWLRAARSAKHGWLLGRVNALFASYTCFKTTSISRVAFYTFYSQSSQDGQEEQPNLRAEQDPCAESMVTKYTKRHDSRLGNVTLV